MHTREHALEAMDLLWHNYYLVGQFVDFDRMPMEKAVEHLKQKNVSQRKMGIATYLSNIGYVVSGWALWELYSGELCAGLPNPGTGQGTCVDQVASSLAANRIAFPQKDWFVGGLALRNLVAHYSGRVSGERAEKHFKKAQAVFPTLTKNPADYVTIEFGEVCDIYLNIEDFIRDTSRGS